MKERGAIFGLVLLFLPAAGAALAEDFSPRHIEGLVAWYDARELYGEQVKLRDGEAVTVWPDSSGNGHDLSDEQRGASAIFRPLRLNELPVVEIREASSFLVANPFDLADHTIVLVHSTNTSSRALFSSDANDQSGVVLNADGGVHQLRRGLKSWAYNVPQPPTGFAVTALSRAGDALHATVDGAPRSGKVRSVETLRVGHLFRIRFSRAVVRDAKGMSLAELLFFDRSLDDDELGSLSAYLADKYGLASVAPMQETAPREAFDWKQARILARLSSTAEVELNLEDGVAIDWNAPSEVSAPLRHDPRNESAKLHCTRDGTRIRLAVDLNLTSSAPETRLSILVLKNGETYLGDIGTAQAVAGANGDTLLAGKHEFSLKLDDGDYFEVMVARIGAAGAVSMVPLNSFLVVAVE